MMLYLQAGLLDQLSMLFSAFGRPASIELLVLINRRFSRDLPIQPDYVGKTIDTIASEKIIVEWEEKTGIDRVLMRKLQE